MRITILIGNGFDVSIGIESSYSKFYEWYCKQSSIYKYINEFKEDILKDMMSDVPEEERTWADFELGLGKYTAHFSPEQAPQFLDCCEDAQEGIIRYLKKQQSKCDVAAISDNSLSEFINSIGNCYQELPDIEKMAVNEICNNVKDEDRHISFLSFNYTGIFEEILKRFPSLTITKWRHGGIDRVCKIDPNVIHVHGTISEFPILGVNDESQIANKELLHTPQFKEIMIKAESVLALGHLWHRQAEAQISQSRLVCVFGMSLGETDATWWRRLAQWLKTDNKRHLVIYWYDQNPPNGISVRKQLECKNKVIERFLSYSQLTDDEKDRIRTRIHIIINTNKFLRIPKAEVTKDTTIDLVPVKDAAMAI